MPTAATHITILQRLAASDPNFASLLGDSSAEEDSPEGKKARFANLGAIGPDIMYAMTDYGSGLQDFENFLVKIAGTFRSISELMEEVSRYVDGVESTITMGVSDSLKQTFDLISGIALEGILALVVEGGVNFFPIFEARRQQDQIREKWFWADHLHYVRSGAFAKRLLANCQKTGNPNLEAYAYGYLTHYVTDTVGHPYVNQIVQSTWRCYWQRHHLVENFIDSYIWDRWHATVPAPSPFDDQTLDRVTSSPNPIGAGAPMTYARLNDLILIGTPAYDPVDGVIDTVAEKIKKGLFDIGVAEDTSVAPPNDADFNAWTAIMAQTIKDVYNEPDRKPGDATALPGHSENMAPERSEGYPTPDDIAGAYGLLRLVLRVGTEESIKEPACPNIVGDISAAAQKLWDDVKNDLGSIPPPPNIPSTSGHFSWDALWDAIKQTAEWLWDVGKAVGNAVFDAIKDSINLVGTAVSDTIKYLLYVLNKWLFSMYRGLRDVLVMAGYSSPFADQLTMSFGPFHATALWTSQGNMAPGRYPAEEVASERAYVFSNYNPAIPPSALTEEVEHPAVYFTAPYQGEPPALNHVGPAIPAKPDSFIDSPLGPDDMFSESGPQGVDIKGQIQTKAKNFGEALANCAKAISLACNDLGRLHLPDYNLDGDRGYAWPTWDVTPWPYLDGSLNTVVKDPLDPGNSLNAVGYATVNAVPAS